VKDNKLPRTNARFVCQRLWKSIGDHKIATILKAEAFNVLSLHQAKKRLHDLVIESINSASRPWRRLKLRKPMQRTTLIHT
jgi:hypothetical protein